MADPLSKFSIDVPEGAFLFHEGDPGEIMYVLQSGSIRIVKSAASGLKTLGLLKPGEFFGEMAIVNHKPRGASAQAVEASRVIAIDAKKFEQMIAANTEIAVRLIRKLAERLETADSLIGVLMEKDPKTRVVLGLLREARAMGTTLENGVTSIPCGVVELAEQWSLTPTETDDVLHRLTRLGVLELATHETRILSMERLSEFETFLRSSA